MELNFVEIFIHKDGSISRIFADKYILDIENSNLCIKKNWIEFIQMTLIKIF